jgi:oligoendopeptidase F
VQRRIEDYLLTHNAYKSVYIRLYSYAELVSSIDSSNTRALTLLDEIAEKDTEIAKIIESFAKWLDKLYHADEIIAGSTFLNENKYYLKKLLQNTNAMQNEEVEKAVYKMQSTGSKAWQRLYMELVNHTYVCHYQNSE